MAPLIQATHAASQQLVIDVRMAADSGIGTYIRNVVPRVTAARPDWCITLLSRRGWPAGEPWVARHRVAVRECRSTPYSVGEQLELIARTPRGARLFWSPHFNIPLLHRGTLVVTVHDVAHLALPDLVARRIKHGYARLLFEAVRRKAAAIMCDSAFTRDEFARLVGARTPPPEVIHLGVAPEWFAAQPPVSSTPATPYIVAVGNVKPHKNLGTLLRAFASIAGRVPHELVLAGRMEGMRTVDDDVVRAAASAGNVRFTGEISDVALRGLVAGADALVMPSYYEGFGLPPLEAMAAGCPTLVSTAGSLPEVCGDAALYCDPADAHAMASQLERLLGDDALRRSLAERGRAHAATFTWEGCARQALTVLEEAMSAGEARGRGRRGDPLREAARSA